MLTIDDIRKEQVLAEIISQRDIMIMNQHVDMVNLKEANTQLEAKIKTLEPTVKGE